MANSIESTLVETRVFQPPQSFVEQAHVAGQAGYQALLEAADRDPDAGTDIDRHGSRRDWRVQRAD